MSGNGRVVDASEIGGETGVSGSDIERQIEQRRTIVGLEDNLAASAQLEGQADVRDPRRLDPGQNETVAYIPGQGVQVVSEGSAPTADRPTNGQEPGQQQPQPPDRQSGSGIGPGGVEGSEEAVPPSERDAPQNDSTEGIGSDQTGRVEEGQGIDIPEIADGQDVIDASEIGGETGVSGSDIEQAVASGKTITDLDDSPAVAAQLERQFGIDPREFEEGGGQALVPGRGLVVQPSEDEIQEQAQGVEQELVGEQITDISTDLVATGAEFREEDIQVSQTQDGSLRAELSPVGEARVQNIAERQQEEAAERQIERELNTAFSDQDVSIDDSGEVVVSENVRQEVIEQNIAEENPNVSEGDVSFENGEPQVDQPEQPEQPESGGSSPSPQQPGGERPSVPDPPDPAEQVAQETGLEQGEGFTIDDAGEPTVDTSSGGQKDEPALRQGMGGERPDSEPDPLDEFVTGAGDAAAGITDADPADVQAGLRRSGQAITQAARQNARERREDNLAERAEGTVFEETARAFEGGALTFGRDPDEVGTDIAAVGNIPAAAAGTIGIGRSGDELAETGLAGVASGNPSELVIRSVEEAAEPRDTTTLDEALQEDAAKTGAAAGAAATAARKRPGTTAFRIALGGATGAAGGVGAGRGVRSIRGRVRTRGLDRVDADELTNRDTLEAEENPSSANPEDQFPGFDEGILEDQGAAEAFRQQADEFTPNRVADEFSGEGTDVKKALDVEPEADGDAAFQTQGGDYESPGGFVGPELSPNFLRLSGNTGREAEFSLRPGLPDTGNKPTGVVARTDVEEPPSQVNTLDDLNEYLRNREGDTTAFVKPSDAVNPGEAEAIIPSGAKFVDAGQDFYTEIAGQRVTIRTVERPDAGDARRASSDGDGAGSVVDDAATREDRDAPTDPLDVGDDAGTAGSRPRSSPGPDRSNRGQTIDEISERPQRPVDRPAPVPSGGSSEVERPPDRASSGAAGSAPSSTPSPGFSSSPFESPGVSSSPFPGLSVTGSGSEFDESGLGTPGGSGDSPGSPQDEPPGSPGGPGSPSEGMPPGSPSTPGSPGSSGSPPFSPGSPSRPPRFDREDDDNRRSPDGGRREAGIGFSGPSDAGGTDYLAETLTGISEGGLNIDAATAVGDSDSGFLATQAQASESSGFEEATDLFSFGGDGR